MKCIFSAMLLLIAFAKSRAQTTTENQVLSITGVTYSGGYMATVNQKQAGSVDLRFNWPGHSDSVITSVSQGVHTFFLYGALDINGTVKVKAENVNAQAYGWVEYSLATHNILPLRLGEIKSEKVGERTYKVYVSVLEASEVKQVWIRLSTDGGITYKKVPVLLSKTASGPYTFTTIISF